MEQSDIRTMSTLEKENKERKKAEKARRQSDKTMKAILAASPAGIGLVRNRILGWANKAFCNFRHFFEQLRIFIRIYFATKGTKFNYNDQRSWRYF